MRERSLAVIGALLLLAVTGCDRSGGWRESDTVPAPRSVIPTNDPLESVRRAPGAYCATKQLGKSFKKNGVTYTCKAPKPYRWRK